MERKGGLVEEVERSGETSSFAAEMSFVVSICAPLIITAAVFMKSIVERYCKTSECMLSCK